MKKFIALFCLLLCSATLMYGQKTRFGQSLPKAKTGVDYPIQLHVSGAHVRSICSNVFNVINTVKCQDMMYVDAIIDGKKIELAGNIEVDYIRFNLPPGDYQARMKTKNPDTTLTTFGQEYELVLADKSLWSGKISGYSE
ncbi:MAG: hypothetical protein WAN35_05630 [Terracidiphilus sp.]|jgi:hypothetical protein